jgi:hypothetical protein
MSVSEEGPKVLWRDLLIPQITEPFIEVRFILEEYLRANTIAERNKELWLLACEVAVIEVSEDKCSFTRLMQSKNLDSFGDPRGVRVAVSPAEIGFLTSSIHKALMEHINTH